MYIEKSAIAKAFRQLSRRVPSRGTRKTARKIVSIPKKKNRKQKFSVLGNRCETFAHETRVARTPDALAFGARTRFTGFIAYRHNNVVQRRSAQKNQNDNTITTAVIVIIIRRRIITTRVHTNGN